MADCKYQSFTALSKINDPDLLLESFILNAAPDHPNDITITIFEKSKKDWQLLSSSEPSYLSLSKHHLEALKFYESQNSAHDFFIYNKQDDAWYCAYYGLTNASYALYISTPIENFIVDTAYLQQLFHFYCHQLHMLHSTYHDALTGLLNRRSFDKKIFQLIEQSQLGLRKSSDTPSFYVMLDIDHFKNINDEFGHLYGDEVLLQLAQLMEDSFRDNDLLFRYGGEEFAVVLMNTTQEESHSVLERFRENVANYHFPKIKQVSISIGYTTFDTELTIDETIARADSALYFSKEHGRNKTSYYQDLVDDNKVDAIVRDNDGDLLLF